MTWKKQNWKIGIKIFAILNFLPMTLDAVKRLDKINTTVYSEIWLAYTSEREVVISKAWKQNNFASCDNS